ncbi:MAG: DUF3822 family protein [Bacteroidales bacterium]
MNTDTQNFANPSLWYAAIKISSGEVHYELFNNLEDNSLIYKSIDIYSDSGSYLNNVENAIYDNPILLQEFGRIRVVIDTTKFMLVPTELVSDDSKDMLFTQLFPDYDGEVMVNELKGSDASIIFGVDKGLVAFLKRTFQNLMILHHLTPICEYFYAKNKLGNDVSRAYLSVYGDKVDISVFANSSILFANSYKINGSGDVVFYLLNIWKQLGLDVMRDELHICGDTTMRDELMPTMREYITYVLPVVFPPAIFKYGKDIMKVPFNMILLPLCE